MALLLGVPIDRNIRDQVSGTTTKKSCQSLPSSLPQVHFNGNSADPFDKLGKVNQTRTHQEEGHNHCDPAVGERVKMAHASCRCPTWRPVGPAALSGEKHTRQVRRQGGSQQQLGQSSCGGRLGEKWLSQILNKRSNVAWATLKAIARCLSGEEEPGLEPARVAGQDCDNEGRFPSCHQCKRSKASRVAKASLYCQFLGQGHTTHILG